MLCIADEGQAECEWCWSAQGWAAAKHRGKGDGDYLDEVSGTKSF